MSSELPLVSILLTSFNQQEIIRTAIQSALDQTYSRLEIIISDDCSSDNSYEAILDALRDYKGPHQIVLNRNEKNLGYSAHLSKIAFMSKGELMFVAGGDDISLSNRCERVVDVWLQNNRVPDLIATDFVDLDEEGNLHTQVSPTDLSRYKTFDDWIANRPYVVGATHAWSRRLLTRFGKIMAGDAEDQVMVFRAIMSGGAINLREPLVLYRRGGNSSKSHFKSVDKFIATRKRSSLSVLKEIAQLQRDSEVAGVGSQMRKAMAEQQAREIYTQKILSAKTLSDRLKLLFRSSEVSFGHRIRMFIYAASPLIFKPWFALKYWIRGAN